MQVLRGFLITVENASQTKRTQVCMTGTQALIGRTHSMEHDDLQGGCGALLPIWTPLKPCCISLQAGDEMVTVLQERYGTGMWPPKVGRGLVWRDIPCMMLKATLPCVRPSRTYDHCTMHGSKREICWETTNLEHPFLPALPFLTAQYVRRPRVLQARDREVPRRGVRLCGGRGRQLQPGDPCPRRPQRARQGLHSLQPGQA